MINIVKSKGKTNVLNLYRKLYFCDKLTKKQKRKISSKLREIEHIS